MEVDTEDSSRGGEDPDSGVTIYRDGAVTAAGLHDARLAAAMDLDDSMDVDAHSATVRSSQESGIGQQQDGGRSQKRLPAPPAVRGAAEWHASWQASKGKHASCMPCSQRFEDNELRISRPYDARAKTTRYVHAHCVPLLWPCRRRREHPACCFLTD